jgi:hypothetical protein
MPETATLLGAVPMPGHVSPLIEREAHKRLAAHRVNGEWFRIDPATALLAIDEAKRFYEQNFTGIHPVGKRRFTIRRPEPVTEAAQ